MSLSPKNQKLVTAVLVAGGMSFFALGTVLLIKSMRSSGWPSVEGRITGYHLTSESRSKQMKPGFAVALDYRYEVDGKTYEGNAFSHASDSMGQIHPTKETAIEEYHHAPDFHKWQPGMNVPVFYDPEKTSDAVLKTGSTRPGWLLCGIGAMVTAIGIRESWKLRRLPASGNTRATPSA